MSRFKAFAKLWHVSLRDKTFYIMHGSDSLKNQTLHNFVYPSYIMFERN